MRGIFEDLTGKIFGKFKVLGLLPERWRGYAVWRVQCECGSLEGKTSTFHLTRKIKPKRSCGCLWKRPTGESAKLRILKDYKHNSKRRSVSWELSDIQFFALIQSNCHYCGRPPSGICHPPDANGSFIYNGVDRIDNAVGYVDENVVPCCRVCNWAKGKMSYSDFMGYLCQPIDYHNKKQTFHSIYESKVMAAGSH